MLERPPRWASSGKTPRPGSGPTTRARCGAGINVEFPDPDDGDAVLIVDETADEKSSGNAAGAARQYSGTVGGTALC